MQMQLTTVNQWVHDQDEALQFYTEKLGMELRDDVTVAEMGNFRWLTVGPVGQPDIAVVLMAIPGPPVFDPETTAQLQDLVAKGASGGLFFQTDDIQATYEELKGKGVEFTQEPMQQPYGIDAGFRDPSGNHMRIMQSERRARCPGRAPLRRSSPRPLSRPTSRSTTNTSGSCGAITPPAPRAP